MMWLLSLPGAVKRWAIIAGAAVLAALGLYAKGRSDGRAKIEAKALKAALDAERERQELDDEIAGDVDLATRARRSGLVRPDR